MSLAKEIEDFIESKLRENGFELVDLQYLRESARWVLRIFVDKPEGVTLDDCECVSEFMGRWLDTTPYFTHRYTLEVSSPGVNRALKTEEHFRRFVGKAVKVSIFEPMNLESRQRNFSGILVECKDRKISVVDATSGLVQIPLERIAKAHLNVI